MDISLLDALTDLGLPMLAFGGLSNSNHVRQALEHDGVAAAVIGNSLNYQEQSIQTLKLQLTDRPYGLIPAMASFHSTDMTVKTCKRCLYRDDHPLGLDH